MVTNKTAKCRHCGEVISDWQDAGSYGGQWIHKTCWSEIFQESQIKGIEISAIRSPVEVASKLEAPMMISLLMFHFGFALLFIGWYVLTQNSDDSGILLLALGLIIPVVGAAGIVYNIAGRRRIELIRQNLDAGGGW